MATRHMTVRVGRRVWRLTAMEAAGVFAVLAEGRQGLLDSPDGTRSSCHGTPAELDAADRGAGKLQSACLAMKQPEKST